MEIKSGWNMIYDIPESPLFNKVEVNGRLVFDSSKPNLHLRAKYLFVRSGELIVGDDSAPFPGQAKITLSGEKDSEYMAYDNQIEAGNKMIANTALVKMVGLPRDRFSRLTKSVEA